MENGIAVLRWAVETVAIAVDRGLWAALYAVWFIPRGVAAKKLADGYMIALPTSVRVLTGAVGVTQAQGSATNPGAELLVRMCAEETD